MTDIPPYPPSHESDVHPYNREENCLVGNTIVYTWGGSHFCWSDASLGSKVFCWSDVQLMQKFGVNIPEEQQYEELTEKERDRFVTLTCRVKGYPETKEMKRQVETDMTVSDIRMTVNEVLKRVNVTLLKD